MRFLAPINMKELWHTMYTDKQRKSGERGGEEREGEEWREGNYIHCWMKGKLRNSKVIDN